MKKTLSLDDFFTKLIEFTQSARRMYLSLLQAMASPLLA
jgi:hypothetical protein